MKDINVPLLGPEQVADGLVEVGGELQGIVPLRRGEQLLVPFFSD